MKYENKKPDVASALQAISSKRSREQVKLERLEPFIGAIDEALALGWKWSPILALIRESGGPGLTRREAERLYDQLKGNAGHSDGAATTATAGNELADAPGHGSDDREAA